MADVTAMIGGDALQAADRDGLAIQSSTPAGGFARAVAGTPEDSGEYVRLPVNHVRIGVASLSNQPDVFRHIGMRRACPLTIDNFVEIIRIACIGR